MCDRGRMDIGGDGGGGGNDCVSGGAVLRRQRWVWCNMLRWVGRFARCKIESILGALGVTHDRACLGV